MTFDSRTANVESMYSSLSRQTDIPHHHFYSSHFISSHLTSSRLHLVPSCLFAFPLYTTLGYSSKYATKYVCMYICIYIVSLSLSFIHSFFLFLCCCCYCCWVGACGGYIHFVRFRICLPDWEKEDEGWLPPPPHPSPPGFGLVYTRGTYYIYYSIQE